MAASVVLARIAAWEQAGLIDHPLAERLRAAEAATVAAPGPVAPPTTAAEAPVPAPAAASQLPAARLRSSGFILEFFAYLGGLFVLLAWYAWFVTQDPISDVARNRGIAVATLVPAVLLGGAGWVLATRPDERLRRAAAIALAVAVANVGVGVNAVVMVLTLARDGEAAVAMGAAAAVAAAVVARLRHPGALTQAALMAAWAALGLGLAAWVEATMAPRELDGSLPLSMDDQLRWNVVRLGWWWLVAAVPAVILRLRPDRAPGHPSRDAVTRIAIGAIAVVGSATAALATYDWSSARGGEPIFGPWPAAAIMVGVGAVFVAAARVSGSRIHLVTAGVAILVGLTYLNVELVVDVVGAPAALLVEGAILLAVAVLGWAAGRFVTRRTGDAREPG